MSPADLFTVMTPFATDHFAGDPSLADTHSSRLAPPKRTTASEGASRSVFPGATTFGTGCQTSVSSGRIGFADVCATACVAASTSTARIGREVMVALQSYLASI